MGPRGDVRPLVFLIVVLVPPLPPGSTQGSMESHGSLKEKVPMADRVRLAVYPQPHATYCFKRLQETGASEICPDLICPSNATCVNSTHCACLEGFQSRGSRFFNDTLETCDDPMSGWVHSSFRLVVPCKAASEIKN
nr:uncharacterized protein LOC112544874 isoform X2 [Pelodiscus sinensis]|eukprot:XP_025037728.1 uncharacterized protein LOC112544874 isoform X2 [Pelodiscus sinensis]